MILHRRLGAFGCGVSRYFESLFYHRWISRPVTRFFIAFRTYRIASDRSSAPRARESQVRQDGTQLVQHHRPRSRPETIGCPIGFSANVSLILIFSLWERRPGHLDFRSQVYTWEPPRGLKSLILVIIRWRGCCSRLKAENMLDCLFGWAQQARNIVGLVVAVACSSSLALSLRGRIFLRIRMAFSWKWGSRQWAVAALDNLPDLTLPAQGCADSTPLAVGSF